MVLEQTSYMAILEGGWRLVCTSGATSASAIRPDPIKAILSKAPTLSSLVTRLSPVEGCVAKKAYLFFQTIELRSACLRASALAEVRRGNLSKPLIMLFDSERNCGA